MGSNIVKENQASIHESIEEKGKLIFGSDSFRWRNSGWYCNRNNAWSCIAIRWFLTFREPSLWELHGFTISYRIVGGNGYPSVMNDFSGAPSIMILTYMTNMSIVRKKIRIPIIKIFSDKLQSSMKWMSFIRCTPCA